MARLSFWADRLLTRRDLLKGVTIAVAAAAAARPVADAISRFEFPSPATAAPAGGGPVPAESRNFIDVREFKKSMSVDELNRTAEAYYAILKDWNYQLAKPLAQIEDAPGLLNGFAQLLNGLKLRPGMTVLDFGAGSCWASRWLTQLGMEVIALDVSKTALRIGRELYARQPVFGKTLAPRFLPFDGRRIELPDQRVDCILCLDTLHHVLNPGEVLREMGRILKPGGVAGFSEPGPRHSRTPQSQYEMRNSRVLEDDIQIRDIWAAARQAGFTGLKLAVFSPGVMLLELPEFEDYLNGGEANRRFAEITRSVMQDRRLFFLQKGGSPPPLDSRSRAGLAAKIQTTLAAATVKHNEPLSARITVTNTGRAIWLPPSAGAGGVFLGCHLLDAAGKLLATDFFRHPLAAGAAPIRPGETVKLEVRIPPPPKGDYVLEFDLVSESVGWFASSGSQAVRLAIRVN